MLVRMRRRDEAGHVLPDGARQGRGIYCDRGGIWQRRRIPRVAWLRSCGKKPREAVARRKTNEIAVLGEATFQEVKKCRRAGGDSRGRGRNRWGDSCVRTLDVTHADEASMTIQDVRSRLDFGARAAAMMVRRSTVSCRPTRCERNSYQSRATQSASAMNISGSRTTRPCASSTAR